jgi:DNA polymerase-1
MRLWEQFYEQCGPAGPYNRAYEIEMAARKIVTRMEINGARVDVEYSKRKYQELSDYTESVKDWCKKTYNGTSITSNMQLVRLFENLGAEITEFTPTGNKAVTKDQLKLLTITGNDEVKELAATALKQRKADKIAGSYFLNFINKNVDGFVHPSVKTMGARTGRMSITDPALQTLPKGDDVVRTAFLPKDDDHVIVTSDLDQVEFRMFASLSQDPNLIHLSIALMQLALTHSLKLVVRFIKNLICLAQTSDVILLKVLFMVVCMALVWLSKRSLLVYQSLRCEQFLIRSTLTIRE